MTTLPNRYLSAAPGFLLRSFRFPFSAIISTLTVQTLQTYIRAKVS